MNININNPESLEYFYSFITKAVPLIKQSFLEGTEDKLLNSKYTIDGSVQEKSSAFQSCEVRNVFCKSEVPVIIGTSVSNSFMTVDDDGKILRFEYTRKSNVFELFTNTKYKFSSSCNAFLIPEYNYTEFEEQCFQLRCTDENCELMIFLMKLRMVMNNTFAMYLPFLKVNEVFNEGVL